ncbi:MAG TPA: TIGR03619 family F420-dependent LLM class oxidoreductase [Acidimicrobiia bacterium]|nr:TIGR03619 family F420-dependent LLM class oxidoreductase [Acidimicrobiia bacterium]
MRIGIASAQLGRLAEPAAVKALARAAETVGYSTLWVLDRLPAPVEPRDGYGGLDGVPLPPEQERSLDPFAVLATAAAVTERVRIGTSVLVAPWYPPVVLARMLTSLDVLSDGRLIAGLGTGWSRDEYDAVNADIRRRGRDLDEILDVLDASWSSAEVVGHTGVLARLAPSKNLLRPVQRPRPPLFLAAYTPAAMDRVARRADGWMPAGFPAEAIGAVWNGIRDAAAGYGRDVDRMEMIVRANIHVTDGPVDGDRVSYLGSLDQVIDDVVATRNAGAAEVILHVHGDPGLDEALDVCARIAEAVGMPSFTG